MASGNIYHVTKSTLNITPTSWGSVPTNVTAGLFPYTPASDGIVHISANSTSSSATTTLYIREYYGSGNSTAGAYVFARISLNGALIAGAFPVVKGRKYVLADTTNVSSVSMRFFPLVGG